jgi:hypothetical protein
MLIVQASYLSEPLFLPVCHPISSSGRKTYSLLSELSSPLVLCVPQQFNDAALIWGETSDFLHDVPDESSAAGEVSLGAGDTGLGLVGGGFLLF